MQQLTVKQRQYLKGLAHELIKVRVLGDEREAREAMIEDICNATNASFVQHIGKLIVLYRVSEKAKISLAKL